jgi:hypothetical protein
VKGCSKYINKSNSRDRLNSRGRYKSSRKIIRKWWKCDKAWNMKKYCTSKNIVKSNGSDDALSIEEKTS